MAAIVDRGKHPHAGHGRRDGRGRPADDHDRPATTRSTAERLLLDHPAVVESGEVAGGLRLVLSDGSDAAVADINRRLVEAGIAVHRLEPARVTARGAVPRGHLPLRGARMNGRMITAELLRVRKNRALVIWMFLMTVGAVAAFYLIARAST